MLRNFVPAPMKAVTQANESVLELRRSMKRFFDDFNRNWGEELAEGFPALPKGLMPRMDWDESKEKIVLSIEMTGMTEKDVQIELIENRLTLKGEKKREKKEGRDGHYFTERTFGSFERTLEIPRSVQTDRIDAKVANGILTVTLPKSPDAMKDSRRITVHH